MSCVEEKAIHRGTLAQLCFSNEMALPQRGAGVVGTTIAGIDATIVTFWASMSPPRAGPLKAPSMNCAGDAAFRNPIRDTPERGTCATFGPCDAMAQTISLAIKIQ